MAFPATTSATSRGISPLSMLRLPHTVSEDESPYSSNKGQADNDDNQDDDEDATNGDSIISPPKGRRRYFFANDDDEDHRNYQRHQDPVYEDPPLDPPEESFDTSTDIPLPAAPSPYSPPSGSLMSEDDWSPLRQRPKQQRQSRRPPSSGRQRGLPPRPLSNSLPTPASLASTSSTVLPALQQLKSELQSHRQRVAKLQAENYDWQDQYTAAQLEVLKIKGQLEQAEQEANNRRADLEQQLHALEQENHQLRQQQKQRRRTPKTQSMSTQTEPSPPALTGLPRDANDAACQTDGDLMESSLRPSPLQIPSSLRSRGSSASSSNGTSPSSQSLAEKLGRIRDAAERTALVQEYQVERQRLQDEHAAQLNRLQHQHEAALQQVLDATKTRHQDQLDDLRRALELEHAAQQQDWKQAHDHELWRMRQEFEKSTAVAQEVLKAAVEEASSTSAQLQRQTQARTDLEATVRRLQGELQQARQHQPVAERQLLETIQHECNAIFQRVKHQHQHPSPPPAVSTSSTTTAVRSNSGNSPHAASTPTTTTSWEEANRNLSDLEAYVESLTSKTDR